MAAEQYRVGFIGLGVMGYHIAGYLAKAGHTMAVYNRTASKAERWLAEFGGVCATTPKALAADCDFVFSCVGNDDDLRAVTVGAEGAFHGLGGGAVFIDHSTVSAHVARDLSARATTLGAAFLDAPLSGGEIGAQNGALTVMVGGDEAVFERSRYLINAYARSVALMGPKWCRATNKDDQSDLHCGCTARIGGGALCCRAGGA